MWNLLRRKKNKDHVAGSQPATQPVNRVDELVNKLNKEGRISEIEMELEGLDRSSLSPAEQESWAHVYGIAAFQAGRDAVALERFQEAQRQFPDSAVIRFSLGQQYIRTRAVEKGFGLFKTCKFPQVPREYALAMARYAYLWNRYADGLAFIRPFYEAYKQIKILDDHFLYVRGLPFFSTWWGYLAAFSILSGELAELESVTQFVTKNCHDYDFDFLRLELAAYRGDQPELLIEALENQLEEYPQDGVFRSYRQMNLAVILARAAANKAAAQELLAAAALSGQDFQWLEDIRTLAMAEVACRFGDLALEGEYIEKFLARQPLLFEPDMALNFHLLRYQERLKIRVLER